MLRTSSWINTDSFHENFPGQTLFQTRNEQGSYPLHSNPGKLLKKLIFIYRNPKPQHGSDK
ncbi:MAG: hypothetical protein DRP59_04680 [Spirochaetes bacterium]|nr:MAG: hypothetical protein DRP59_04680 [Spirochaetota bacterium]